MRGSLRCRPAGFTTPGLYRRAQVRQELIDVVRRQVHGYSFACSWNRAPSGTKS